MTAPLGPAKHNLCRKKTFMNVSNRLNQRRTAQLTLLCLLSAGAMALVGCTGKADRIASHLERGQKYYQAADADKALLEVRNVLQMDPKNEPAFVLAGEVNEARAEMQAAYVNYAKAVELNPKDWDAKAALARLYLVAGDVAKAQSTVDEVLGESPDNAEARVVKAALMSRAGHVDQAIAEANKIKFNGAPPQNATLLLAALYAGQHREADALRAVDAALAGDPKNVRLLSAAATLSTRLDDQDKAEHYFSLATEIAPKDWDLWREWANYCDKSKRAAQAQAILRNAIKAEPDDSKRYVTLAEFIFFREGQEAGFKELLSDAAARPKDTEIQFALAQAYQRAGKGDDARKALQNIVRLDASGPSGITARDLLAADALARGQITDARTLLEAVLKANPRDGTALTLRGQLELGHGEYPAAIADLRAAAKDRPDSAKIIGMLAQAHLANKEPELARAAIVDTVKLYPANVDLLLLQAEFMSRTGDVQGALETIAAVLKIAPKNREAYQLKAAVYTGQNDPINTEKAYRDFVQATPNDATSLVLLGRFYMSQKKFSAAITQFDLAAKVAPDPFEPKLEAVSALVAEKKLDEATKRANQSIQDKPTDAGNYQMLGEIKMAQSDFASAITAFNHELELDPKAIKGYVDLARCQALAGDEKSALASLERGIATNPSDTRLYAAEADFLIHAGKIDDAISVYDRLLAIAPNDDLAINNVAFLLTEFKGDKSSLDRALALTARFAGSPNPSYLDSLGWIHYKRGDYAQAVPLLEQAVNLDPKSAVMQLHLGLAFYKDGNLAQAKEHLKIAADSNEHLPSIEEARKILAQG